MAKEFIVTDVEIIEAEDSWEEGEIGKENMWDDNSLVGKKFKSFEEFMKKADDLYSIPAKKENWITGDDGRIDGATTVDADGVPPSKKEMADWKAGKINLMSRTVLVWFYWAESQPTSDEISKEFGIGY